MKRNIFLFLCSFALGAALLQCKPPQVSEEMLKESEKYKPVADAGEDQILPCNEVLRLDGSDSFDPENQKITYTWCCVNSDLKLSYSPGPHAARVTVKQVENTAPFPPGEYLFMLIVENKIFSSAPDFVNILIQEEPELTPGATPTPAAEETPTPAPGITPAPTAGETPAPNRTPTAYAGEDISILYINATEISLNGTGSDPDGDTLSYEWSLVDDEYPFALTSGTSRNTSIVPNAPYTYIPPGKYYLYFIADDGHAHSAPDILTVTVIKPAAIVGSSPAAEYSSIGQAMAAVYDPGSNETRIIVIEQGDYNETIIQKPHTKLLGIPSATGIYPSVHSLLSGETDAVLLMESYTSVEKLNIYVDVPSGSSPPNATDFSSIRVTGTSVTISQIRGWHPAQHSHGDGINIESGGAAVIRDADLRMISGEGIYVKADASLTIQDSLIYHCYGTGIAGDFCDLLVIDNVLLYQAGYHGIGLNNCDTARIENCTIAETSIDSYSGNLEEKQSSIKITAGTSITLRDNLIRMTDYPALYGIHYEEWGNTELLLEYNYISSPQTVPLYLGGALTPSGINSTNTLTTEDPEFVNPQGLDFQLELNSPARGEGSNGSNPGIGEE